LFNRRFGREGCLIGRFLGGNWISPTKKKYLGEGRPRRKKRKAVLLADKQAERKQ